MTMVENKRWFVPNDNLSPIDPADRGGEVRISLVDTEPGQGYIHHVSTSGDHDIEQARWISNQLNGVVVDERYDEDFYWVQLLLDGLFVPDDRCRIAWGACRGRWKAFDNPDHRDVYAVIIAADIYSTPDNPGLSFRIASHPIGRVQEDRERMIEEAALAMALQRFSREMLVAEAARNVSEARGRTYEPLPIPGLRLARPVKANLVDGEEQTYVKEGWGLMSARGGLDQKIPTVEKNE